MSNRKEYTVNDLPHGSGAVIGNFIRSSAFLMYDSPTVIGVSVNQQTAFCLISDTDTTLVADFIVALGTLQYRILDLAGLPGVQRVGNSDIYKFSCNFNQKVIKAGDFGGLFITDTPDVVLLEFVEPTQITVDLLVSSVTGIMSVESTSAHIKEAFEYSDRGLCYIAMPANSRHTNLNIWFNTKECGDTESLTLFVDGTSEDVDIIEKCVLRNIKSIFTLLNLAD